MEKALVDCPQALMAGTDDLYAEGENETYNITFWKSHI
jgi:hypothetical protein